MVAFWGAGVSALSPALWEALFLQEAPGMSCYSPGHQSKGGQSANPALCVLRRDSLRSDAQA